MNRTQQRNILLYLTALQFFLSKLPQTDETVMMLEHCIEIRKLIASDKCAG